MFVVDIKKILKKKLYFQEEFNTSQVVFNYVSHLHIFRYCWNILYFSTFLELWNGGEDEHADGGEQEQRGHDHQNLCMLTFLSLYNQNSKLTLAAFEEFGFSNMFQICCLILAQYSPAKGLSYLHNNYLSLDKLHHVYNVYINHADLLVVVEALVPQGQQPGGPLQRVGAARLWSKNIWHDMIIT